MSNLQPILEFILTDHALLEMERRGIAASEVRAALARPGQTEMARAGRAVYQAQFEAGKPPKTCLLRVFVDVDRQPPQVVTVYRTSKLEKYWR